MHEMSIVVTLLDKILDIAKENAVSRVVEVEVECGAQKMVVPEALEMAFTAATRDTIVEGAKLIITEKPVLALCNICNHRFRPETHVYSCPRCREADVSIIEGNDILLLSVGCDVEEDSTGVDHS